MSKNAAERAARLVGTRFRPQGRRAATGLDCLGLVMLAYGIDENDVPRDYRLRGSHFEKLLRSSKRWFRRVSRTQARAGDVLVLRAAPDQLHLAIISAGGFIHADARIGRVVETPGKPAFPVVALLRRRSRARKDG